MTLPSIRQGEFVDLQPLQAEHAAITLQWRQGARAQYLNEGAQNIDEQRQWILSRPASEYNYLISLKNGHPVGMLSLIGVDFRHRHGESARFLIGDEQAVRGLPAAVEAMKLLYQLAFDELGLLRVHGHIAADNHLMIKWQKFLGMKEEGRLRQHYLIHGAYQDAVLFGLLADEYRQQALPKMNLLIAAGRKPATSGQVAG